MKKQASHGSQQSDKTGLTQVDLTDGPPMTPAAPPQPSPPVFGTGWFSFFCCCLKKNENIRTSGDEPTNRYA